MESVDLIKLAIIKALRLSVEKQNCFNEYEVMKTFKKIIDEEKLGKNHKAKYIDRARSSSRHLISSNTEKSKSLREKGNQIMKSKDKTFDDCLQAASIYTNAVFVAPLPAVENDYFLKSRKPLALQNNEGIDDKENTLALAYANRAIAFQECGYYAKAYDDCLCALRYGYPRKMKTKIIIRQAYCCLKLGRLKQLREYLAELESINLNESFRRQKQELENSLELLERKQITNRQNLINDGIQLEEGVESLSNDLQNLPITETGNRNKVKIEMSASRGRCMRAKQLIKENELIFYAPVLEFLPTDGPTVCQQCGNQMFIPYPCSACYCRAVYCSLKCQLEHQHLHCFECIGYQYGIFERIGIGHVAMRMLLVGLPKVLPSLSHVKTSNDLWLDLTKYTMKCDVFENANKYSYFETLSLMTNFKGMSPDDLVEFVVLADEMTWYLSECTEFFELFANSSVSEAEWKLIIASLLLRHIGQAIVNAHAFQSLTYRENDEIHLTHANDFVLLKPKLWTSLHHLRCGFLHKFSSYKIVASANLPFLSICNHHCSPSLQQQFSKGFLKTFATKDIAAGDEIFNSYFAEYRSSTREQRRTRLESTYGFRCDCSKCTTSDDPDEEFLQFHRLRCQNAKCLHKFIPSSMDLYWWRDYEPYENNPKFKCPKCQTVQSLRWYEEFWRLLGETQTRKSREDLLNFYNELDHHLAEIHQIKIDFGLKIIERFFQMIDDSISLDRVEYEKLENIIRSILHGTLLRSRQNSIEYCARMTYLWDLVALRKINCLKAEMETMLKSTAFLSTEFELVFKNYYDDYIKNVIE